VNGQAVGGLVEESLPAASDQPTGGLKLV